MAVTEGLASLSDRKAFLDFYDHHTLPVQVGFSIIVLLTWYTGLKHYLHRPPDAPVTPKQSAWILSLLASIVSTPIGAVYGLEILRPGWTGSRLLEADAFSDFMAIFFIVYFVIDTTFGILDYGSEFGILTGWVHHFFYMAFLTHAYVRGYTVRHSPCWLPCLRAEMYDEDNKALTWSFLVSFSYTLIMESSSICLSGGRIFPRYLRQDVLFGILFFAFRIVYHLYLLWHIYNVPNPHVIFWPAVVAIFVLHAFWFYQFLAGFRRRMLKKRKAHGSNGNDLKQE